MVESKFYKDNKSSKSNLFKNIVLRVLITIIVTLILLIGFKMNSNFKKTFYHYVYFSRKPPYFIKLNISFLALTGV